MQCGGRTTCDPLQTAHSLKLLAMTAMNIHAQDPRTRTPSSPDVAVISEPVVQRSETPCAASLLTFFALAFAWSWICWLLAPALKSDYPVAATTLSLAGGFGPSLAAVMLGLNNAKG